MLLVDVESNATMIRIAFPQRSLSFLEEPLTSTSMHRHTSSGNLGNNLTESLAGSMRRTCTRFLDVNCPSFIEAVREVNLHSSEFCCFAFRNQTKPVPPCH